MQVLFETEASSEEYVSKRLWEKARLDACLLCGASTGVFCRHGTYKRHAGKGIAEPARITRYYCRLCLITFSLLPKCFAARFTRTLADFEREAALPAGPEARAAHPNPHIEDRTRDRWHQNRVRKLEISLKAAVGLLPDVLDRLDGKAPSLADVQRALNTRQALLLLRGLCAMWLSQLLPPIGFLPPPQKSRALRQPPQKSRIGAVKDPALFAELADQHQNGHDPPLNRR